MVEYKSLQEVVEEFHYLNVPVKTELGEMDVPFGYDEFTTYLFSEEKGCQYFPNGKVYIFSAKKYLENDH
ncbi:hypothetical protein HOE37_04000 [Candidatus Woesearchaeota archaeon]|jgi:hypothetical protein|nr:hypothetical protein [Candidatus Woesearchaeota archaeon]MBT4110995.1 hypothetical protein [Candidatus Woesearchaeota archaeon]MBT4336864.1 hypothetical protein [Candidatus Woesearchaeota archaeon]MBT4469821.1 hypothetical protein [Candidatus Woesearchaeota archaeon]MBT6743708.1 hypothetical protein [Candidatus Woesearchaeota archaeon]